MPGQGVQSAQTMEASEHAKTQTAAPAYQPAPKTSGTLALKEDFDTGGWEDF
jgi:hypothetical protein